MQVTCFGVEDSDLDQTKKWLETRNPCGMLGIKMYVRNVLERKYIEVATEDPKSLMPGDVRDLFPMKFGEQVIIVGESDKKQKEMRYWVATIALGKFEVSEPTSIP